MVIPPSQTKGFEGSFEAYNIEGRDQLPIEEKATEVLYAIQKHSTTVVLGETGSGKSTKLPELLLATGRYQGRIGLTLPKRVSAINIAKRLAANLGCQVGEKVGYSIRFDHQVSAKTQIKVLTDGTLLQEMLSDPLLSDYSILIIDDCHERSMYTDMILGLLKKIRKRRTDELKIVISSATIDARLYHSFFNEMPLFRAQVVQVHGRMHPVELFYLDSPTKDYVRQAIQTVKQIHNGEIDPNSGTVLVFLTGKEEIRDFIERFDAEIKADATMEHFKKQSIFCQACYGGLPLNEQVKIFEPAPFNTRKVIVATNIAETSITIDGVVFVVDCCLTKVRVYDPVLNMDQLKVVPSSKSSCNQRGGRAGRTRPGRCYRLCTQSFYESSLPAESQPEIERSDTTGMLLQLKGLGIRNLIDFSYFGKGPSRASLIRSLDLLYNLGAIDDQGELTVERGLPLVELSIDPRCAAAVLVSNGEDYRVCNEVLTIACLLQFSQQLFTSAADSLAITKVKKRPQHGAIEGDHITLLNIFNNLYGTTKSQAQRNGLCRELRLNQWAWDKASEVRQSLRRQLSRMGIPIVASDDYDDASAILKCLVQGFFTNVAMRQFDGSYTNLATPMACSLEIHPSSVLSNLKPKVVMYHELVVVSDRRFMTEVSTIELEWLFDLVPNNYYSDARKQIAIDKHAKEIGEKRRFGQSGIATTTTTSSAFHKTGFKGGGISAKGKKGLNLSELGETVMTSQKQPETCEPSSLKPSFKQPLMAANTVKSSKQPQQSEEPKVKKAEKKPLVGLSFDLGDDDY